MPDIPPATRSLLCHPLTPAPAVRALNASVAWGERGELVFAYTLQGDIARLRLPPPRDGPTDGLWQHSCCEAFVANRGEAAYREFNFSPSGQWAAYAFSAYRERLAAPLPAPPRISTRVSSGRLELVAVVPAAALAPATTGRAFDVGLCAVVESDFSADALSYWALAHAAERPDFHRRESFTLELPAFAGAFPEDRR